MSGLRRKKGLSADPEKVRAWQQRSRKPLKRTEGGLSRANGLKAAGKPAAPRRAAEKAAEGPLSPLEWRCAVWEADQGHCRGCGKAVPLDGDMWSWNAHHAIPKQVLRRRGLFAFVWDVRNGVTLCRRCHERHETATARVSQERLDGRIWAFVDELGSWACDLINRQHPPPSGGTNNPGRES